MKICVKTSVRCSSTSWMVPWSVALLVAYVAVVPARADYVIFNNFGHGNAYDVGSGATLGLPDHHFDEASRFTVPGRDVYLSSLDVAISLVQGSPSTPIPNVNDIDIAVMTNAGGCCGLSLSELPGSVLEMFEFVNAMGPFGHLNPPLHAVSKLRPLLEVGRQYWIAAIVPNPSSTLAAWNSNSIGDTGTGATRDLQDNQGNWFATAGEFTNTFRVTGTPVPEPTSLILFGSGLISLLLFRRKLPPA